MSDLPYAIEAQVDLSQQEIQLLRETYLKEGQDVRLQVKFNYAWGLIRSSLHSDQLEGIALLHEIYSEQPLRRRECLYYLALGNYKLGKFKEAKRFNETLLKLEESNPQALSLKSLINDKVQAEGLIGMGIVGSLVLGSALIIGSLLKKSK